MPDWPRRGRAAIALALLAGACSTLPRLGPTSRDVIERKGASGEPMAGYALVEVTPANISIVAQPRAATFSAPLRTAFGERGNAVIGPGDTLLLNVVEPDAQGVFAGLNGRGSSGLDIQVDQQGMVFVPYAGRIAVAGMTVPQARDAIAARLRGKAVYPQVVLNRHQAGSQMVSVVGDVARTMPLEIPLGGLRLVQALAGAGGPKDKAYQARVTVIRGSRRETLAWADVVGDAGNNIWLMPNDVVEVANEPMRFSIMGAVRNQSLQPFPEKTATLSDAILQAGGLDRTVSGAGGIFVFRMEDPATVEAAGAANPDSPARPVDGRVPTVYRFDFRRPGTLFLANSFQLRDRDLIYVAVSPSAEISAFISTFIAPVTSLGATGRTLAQ